MSATGATAAEPDGRRSVTVVFVGLMLVLLMAALDQTIVSTALPTIVCDLGGLSHISWVVTAYLLAQTAVTPIYGKLGRPLRPQDRAADRAGGLPGRLGPVRPGPEPRRADRLPRTAGPRRRRAHGRHHGGDRRRRLTARAGPLPGGVRRRVRAGQRDRPPAGRLLHHHALVALDLLRQPAHRRAGLQRPRRHAAVAPGRDPPPDRLPRRCAAGRRAHRESSCCPRWAAPTTPGGRHRSSGSAWSPSPCSCSSCSSSSAPPSPSSRLACSATGCSASRARSGWWSALPCSVRSPTCRCSSRWCSAPAPPAPGCRSCR